MTSKTAHASARTHTNTRTHHAKSKKPHWFGSNSPLSIKEAPWIWLQLSPFHRALSTNLAPTFPQKICRKCIREARTPLVLNQIDRSLSCSLGGRIWTNDITNPQMLSRFDFCPCICSCITYKSYKACRFHCRVCVCVCVCVYIYICIHVCIYICIRIHIRIHICICIHIYIYIHRHCVPCPADHNISLYIYMHIYIYIYIYIYVSTAAVSSCAQSFSLYLYIYIYTHLNIYI